ncbi:unnamed protein product, partial [Symbiodinium sp. CCMP2456]
MVEVQCEAAPETEAPGANEDSLETATAHALWLNMEVRPGSREVNVGGGGTPRALPRDILYNAAELLA